MARAIAAIAGCDYADLLRFLTPDDLRGDGPDALPSSTVRYLFRADGSAAFDRDVLAEAIVARVCADYVAVSRWMAGRYLEVFRRAGEAAGLADGRPTDPLLDLFSEHVGLLAGTEGSPEVAGRERVYYLAIAMCDDDRALAARLRETFDATYDAFVPVLELYCTRTGRRPAEGTTIEDLPRLVGSLIEGIVLRRRFDRRIDVRVVAMSILRSLEAWTRPVADDTAPVVPPERVPAPGATAGTGVSADDAVRLLERELAVVDPFGGRGLAIVLEMLDLAPRSSFAYARAAVHARRLVENRAVLDSGPGRRAWVAAAETIALADADRALATEAADLALSVAAAPDEPGGALTAMRRAWLLARLERFSDALHVVRGARAALPVATPESMLCAAVEAYALLMTGPVPAAALAAERALEGTAGAGHEFGAAMLARARLLVGELGAAADAARAAGPSSPPNVGTTQLVLSRGMVALARGRDVEALDYLRLVPEHLRRVGSRNPAGWAWLEPTVECLVRGGDLARARALVEEQAPTSETWGTPVVLAALARARAAVATQPAERLARLRDAVEVLEGSEARVERLTSLRMLEAASGRPPSSDPDDLGVVPVTPSAASAPVFTARVGEVAELVADGLRDREIAERLGISVRTVERHVASALAAAGCATRVELAVRITASR